MPYRLSDVLDLNSVTQKHSLFCRSNRSRLSSNQTNLGCRPFSKMALAHRMVSSPRRRPRRHLCPPTAPCWRLIEAASPPRRRPGRKSAPKLCLSSRNREPLPSCWITPCLMVTLATAPRTPSLMPNPTLRTPACPWSPPTGARFITRQPAATRRSLNWNSQRRRSRRRHRPAAVCRSCPVTWLRMEEEVLAQRGGRHGMCFPGVRMEGRREKSGRFLVPVSFSCPSLGLLPQETVDLKKTVAECCCCVAEQKKARADAKYKQEVR